MKIVYQCCVLLTFLTCCEGAHAQITTNQSDRWTDRIRVYLSHGDYNDAITYCQEVAADYEKQENDAIKEKIYSLIAHLYQKTGQLKESNKWLKKVLLINPQEIHYYMMLGQNFNFLNDDRAIKYLEKGLLINPTNSGALTSLGCIYLNKKDIKKALYFLNKSKKVDPEYVFTYVTIGKAYIQEKQYDKALEILDTGYDICKNIYEKDSIWEIRARVYIETGDYERAEEILTKIISKRTMVDFKKNGYWGCPFQALGELYSKKGITGEKEKVLQNYMRMAEVEYNRAFSQYDAAMKCYEYGDYENALNYINRAIVLDEKEQYLILKGYVYLQLRQRDDARRVFAYILDTISSQSIDAQVGIGHIMIGEKKYESAERSFSGALKENPDHDMANLGMAWIYSNKHQHAKAIPYYDAILRNSPSHLLALLGKGNALMGMKQLDAAEEIFNKALKIEPNNQYALAEMGVVELNKGNNEKAETLFKKALTFDNTTYTCPYEGLGLVYLRQGKLDEAEDNFKRSISINPDIEYKKYNGLAKIYIQKGDLEEAKKLLRKSIENYPYDDEAKQLQEQIKTVNM